MIIKQSFSKTDVLRYEIVTLWPFFELVSRFVQSFRGYYAAFFVKIKYGNEWNQMTSLVFFLICHNV